jgi:hypothetical protein
VRAKKSGRQSVSNVVLDPRSQSHDSNETTGVRANQGSVLDKGALMSQTIPFLEAWRILTRTGFHDRNLANKRRDKKKRSGRVSGGMPAWTFIRRFFSLVLSHTMCSTVLEAWSFGSSRLSLALLAEPAGGARSRRRLVCCALS